MKKLIVIDDEYIVVEGIQAMLARMKLGYEVAGAASDGLAGLSLIDQIQPDLVITDIRMPGMDGLSLIETASKSHPETMFVIISGYSEFEYARRALSMGVKGYIDKPISMQKLRDVIEAIEESLAADDRRTDEKLKFRETHARMEEGLGACMKSIADADAAEFYRCATALFAQIQAVSETDADFRRSLYKALCVLSDITAEGNPNVHRETLVSYQETLRLDTSAALHDYYFEIAGRIEKCLEAGATGSRHEAVLAALAYINNNFGRDIGLNEVAESVHLNPAYLSALFKEEVGTSFIKYLTELRLRYAKKFLSDGRKVKEVSTMVGYNNYRYFCDIFKKNVGTTPYEYKNGEKRPW